MSMLRPIVLILVVLSLPAEAQKSLFFTMGNCEMELSLENNISIDAVGDVLASGWAPDPDAVADCLVEATIERALEDGFEQLSQSEEGRAFMAKVETALSNRGFPTAPPPNPGPTSGDDAQDPVSGSGPANDRLRERVEEQERELTEARRLSELQSSVLLSFTDSRESELPNYDEEAIRSEWQQSRQRLIRFWQQSLSDNPGDDFAGQMLNVLQAGDRASDP